MSMLVRKIAIELDADETQCFTNYMRNNNLDSVDEAVKHAALKSLPPRKRWKGK